MGIRIKLLTLLGVGALFSPVVMAAPDGGLLITRASSTAWQVRLIAGTQAKQFNGTIESSVAFGSMNNVLLEPEDSASLTAPDKIGMTLGVYPGGTDGVDFSVAGDAKLCLRDVGNAGLKIYVGATLATATLVSSPVALAGTDACSPTVSTPTTTTRKFHPGQYVAMMRGNHTQDAMYKATNHPGVRGVMKRYTWRSLEPSLGVYDFSVIQSDLDWARSYGLQLVVMIEDKTFVNEKPGPAYLDAYTLANRANGYTLQRWSPYVVSRMNALTAAMGARLDSHPALEGIIVGEETAPSLAGTVLDAYAYTPEKYRDAYISMLSAAANAFPTSRIFFYQNYFPRNQGYIADVITAVAAKGIVLGGPDDVPDDATLRTMSYPFYTQFYGKVKMFIQVEGRCYAHAHATSGYSTKYWTMPELFAYARDKLHSNYVFWVNYPKPLYSDSYAFPDAVPVIGANPTFN